MAHSYSQRKTCYNFDVCQGSMLWGREHVLCIQNCQSIFFCTQFLFLFLPFRTSFSYGSLLHHLISRVFDIGTLLRVWHTGIYSFSGHISGSSLWCCLSYPQCTFRKWVIIDVHRLFENANAKSDLHRGRKELFGLQNIDINTF